MIGPAGFNVADSHKKPELIYHLSKSCWGNGYAFEASNACIEIASRHPHIRTICASASPENAASLRILEKLGFRFVEMRFFEDVQQEEPYYEYTVKKR